MPTSHYLSACPGLAYFRPTNLPEPGQPYRGNCIDSILQSLEGNEAVTLFSQENFGYSRS